MCSNFAATMNCTSRSFEPSLWSKIMFTAPGNIIPKKKLFPFKDIVKAKWRDLVVEKDEDGTEKVNRINYEVCLLQALRDNVRSKEIWLVGSNRYQNPGLYLPTDFEQQRSDYYEALKQPTEANAFV